MPYRSQPSRRKRLPSPQSFLDLYDGRDRVVRRGVSCFLADLERQYADNQVESDWLSAEGAANLFGLRSWRERRLVLQHILFSGYLSDMGRMERLFALGYPLRIQLLASFHEGLSPPNATGKRRRRDGEPDLASLWPDGTNVCIRAQDLPNAYVALLDALENQTHSSPTTPTTAPGALERLLRQWEWIALPDVESGDLMDLQCARSGIDEERNDLLVTTLAPFLRPHDWLIARGTYPYELRLWLNEPGRVVKLSQYFEAFTVCWSSDSPAALATIAPPSHSGCDNSATRAAVASALSGLPAATRSALDAHALEELVGRGASIEISSTSLVTGTLPREASVQEAMYVYAPILLTVFAISGEMRTGEALSGTLRKGPIGDLISFTISVASKHAP